jgi:RsmE family RNA methyltransferase
MWMVLLLCTTRSLVSLRYFSHRTLYRRHGEFHSTTFLNLNRFLFDPTELTETDSDTVPSVTIGKDDYRTIHAAKILGLQNGETVRAGIVDDGDTSASFSLSPYAGLVTDVARIQWIPEGKVKKAEPLGNGKPPGSLRITLHDLVTPPKLLDEPPVSLLLALPRPLQLNRMLPMICQMGVDHLILTHADKVPREYFGSHLFRDPMRLREKLVEGLCQTSVDVRLPRITIVRNLRHFLSNDLESLYPLHEYARVMAHPERIGETGMEPVVGRFDENVVFPVSVPRRRVLLAVGPEGGWTEPEELNLLTQEYNFQTVTLGPRVLRSDVAVIALMALANEACQSNNGKPDPPS